MLGLKRGAPGFATLNALMLEKYTLFIADTYVNEDPSAEMLANIAVMAAEEVRRFGLPPKVAFLSHSNFGSSERGSARKMRAGARPVRQDGARHRMRRRDARRRRAVRGRAAQGACPTATLHGEANLLICPNLDAANILFNVLKMTGGNGVTVGPILMGAKGSAHILTPSATVRRVVNMTALAVANANSTR